MGDDETDRDRSPLPGMTEIDRELERLRERLGALHASVEGLGREQEPERAPSPTVAIPAGAGRDREGPAVEAPPSTPGPVSSPPPATPPPPPPRPGPPPKPSLTAGSAEALAVPAPREMPPGEAATTEPAAESPAAAYAPSPAREGGETPADPPAGDGPQGAAAAGEPAGGVAAVAASFVVVDAGPIAGLAAARRFEDAISALPAVREVRLRRFARHRAEIEVGLSGPQALGAELATLERTVEIEALHEDRLVLRLGESTPEGAGG